MFTLTPFMDHTKLVSTSMDRSLILWTVKADVLSEGNVAAPSEGSWRAKTEDVPIERDLGNKHC